MYKFTLVVQHIDIKNNIKHDTIKTIFLWALNFGYSSITDEIIASICTNFIKFK